jgi:hypothetical protein
MSRLEDRLRDAYRDEAGAVTPESIFRLGAAIAAQSPRPARSRRARKWSRWLAPLAAAAAVALIVVVAAVAVPHGAGQPQATSGTPPKFLIDDSTGVSPLPVRNATTGALVARVTVPPGYPGGNSRTYINAVATWNGRDYLVAEYANPCRSWIYQFSLDSAGQPSALTPFAALPTIPTSVNSLTVSGNGKMVAFATAACMGAKAQPNYLGVTNLRTGHTTRWTFPDHDAAGSVSLTADGRQLCYSLEGEGSSSLIRVIPTSAPPGRATDFGRIVAPVQAGQFFSFAVISPDGGKVYFVTSTQPGLHQTKPMTGQIRVTNLATGRSRVVYAPAGTPGLVTSDPGVRYLIVQLQGQPSKLVRLDLATGKTTDLPARRFSLPAVLYW